MGQDQQCQRNGVQSGSLLLVRTSTVPVSQRFARLHTLFHATMSLRSNRGRRSRSSSDNGAIVRKASAAYNAQQRRTKQTSLNSLDAFWSGIDEAELLQLQQQHDPNAVAGGKQRRAQDAFQKRASRRLKQTSSQTKKTVDSKQDEQDEEDRRKAGSSSRALVEEDDVPVKQVTFETSTTVQNISDTPATKKSEKKPSLWRKLLKGK